ncbi:MFS transporter [Trinickia terrae]|uniref:MFS transporter n=1 Tax=Trinickia terrae TaxID=2571161 RepID=A0A4U1IFU5_9BURK|nr:MFS transporter [Trinickia terrae]TKC92623.1 MFS transporter [Trinickia terrae]
METTQPIFTPTIARILATVSVAFVVTQLDVTIVNIALPRIGSDLHADVAKLQWIVDAYTLAFAVLMLSGGVLGDRFGARRLFAGGIALFALASLACGLAPNVATLIGARALQGVSAAAMLPNSLALLNQACRHDPRLRARAVGLWTASGAVSIAAGPIAGGLLIAALGWRSIFLVNLPICAAGLLATFAWVPAPAPRPRLATHARTGGIDLPGQCLAIVALTAFTGAVIELRPLGFAHPLIAGSFALALIATVAFLAVQAKSDMPMLPLPLFRDATFSAAVLFGVCVNFAYYGMVFVLSLFLQRVHGDTPLQAGLAFLPLTGGFLISNVASGWVVGRYGPRVPMIAGAATAALGYALLRATQAATPTLALLFPFLLIPSGMGLAVPAMTTAILASVEPQRAGTASAVLNTARQAGGAVGVAAFGALASSEAASHVVSGLQVSALIAAGLLVAGGVLACFIHPHSHRREPVRPAAAVAPSGRGE